MSGDVSFGAFVKSHPARGRQFFFFEPAGLFLLAKIERIVSITEQKANVGCFLPRIRKRDLRQSAKSHFARLAFEREAKGPALGAVATDAKIESSAIGIEARLARARDGECASVAEFLGPSSQSVRLTHVPFPHGLFDFGFQSELLFECVASVRLAGRAVRSSPKECPPNPTRIPMGIGRIVATGANEYRGDHNRNNRLISVRWMAATAANGAKARTGGRGEIRTHEGAEPPAGFQDRCLKPLGHPSGVSVSAVPSAYRASRLYRQN